MQLSVHTQNPQTITYAASVTSKSKARKWLASNVPKGTKRTKKCRQVAKAIVRSGACLSDVDIASFTDLTVISQMLVVRRGWAFSQ